MCRISFELANLCLVPKCLALGRIQGVALFNANLCSCILYGRFNCTLLKMAQSEPKFVG